MTNKPELLTERWQTPDGQSRLQAVIAAIKSRRPWENELVGFAYVDEIPGNRDLRYSDLFRQMRCLR